METFRNEPESRMEEEPFFKGVAHCESWVDRALLDLEVEDFPNVDPKLLEKAKSDLEYGKLLLQPGADLPVQRDFNARFHPLVREIMENENSWGDLGILYVEISNFLSMELTQD